MDGRPGRIEARICQGSTCIGSSSTFTQVAASVQTARQARQ